MVMEAVSHLAQSIRSVGFVPSANMSPCLLLSRHFRELRRSTDVTAAEFSLGQFKEARTRAAGCATAQRSRMPAHGPGATRGRGS